MQVPPAEALIRAFAIGDFSEWAADVLLGGCQVSAAVPLVFWQLRLGLDQVAPCRNSARDAFSKFKDCMPDRCCLRRAGRGVTCGSDGW